MLRCRDRPWPRREMVASSSARAASGRQRLRRLRLSGSTEVGGDVDPAGGDMRPADVERTDDARHGTKALTTLHGPPRDALQPVAADRGGHDDRLRVREAVHAARPGLDLDLVSGDEVEHVEPSGGVVLHRVVEVEPVHGEEEIGMPAELELAPARSLADRSRLRHQIASHGCAGRSPGWQTRARDEPDGARRRDRGGASRRSAGCRGTASR